MWYYITSEVSFTSLSCAFATSCWLSGFHWVGWGSLLLLPHPQTVWTVSPPQNCPVSPKPSSFSQTVQFQKYCPPKQQQQQQLSPKLSCSPQTILFPPNCPVPPKLSCSPQTVLFPPNCPVPPKLSYSPQTVLLPPPPSQNEISK